MDVGWCENTAKSKRKRGDDVVVCVGGNKCARTRDGRKAGKLLVNYLYNAAQRPKLRLRVPKVQAKSVCADLNNCRK